MHFGARVGGGLLLGGSRLGGCACLCDLRPFGRGADCTLGRGWVVACCWVARVWGGCACLCDVRLFGRGADCTLGRNQWAFTTRNQPKGPG